MNRTLILLGSLVTLALAGCGSSSSSTSSTSSSTAASAPASSATATSGAAAAATAQISTATVAGIGVVLVNGQGHVLYIFAPDQHKSVTCVGACAQVWPPVKATSTSKPTVSGQVKSSLLASDPDPSGGRVITYAGWPLYAYVGDSGAGTANGEAENLNGGVWYAIAPSGQVIKSSSGG